MEIKKISKGTISKRKDGKWIGQCIISYDDNSKKRISVSAKTELECSRKLSIKKNEYIYLAENESASNEQENSKTTYIKYLLTEWLSEKEKERISPKTLSSYKYIIAKHFKHFDELSPDEITTSHILEFRNYCLEKLNLSTGTYKKIHSIINDSFKKLIRTHIVETNPCEYIKSVEVEEKEKEIFTEKEINIILNEAKIHDKKSKRCKCMYPYILFALMTGARRAEICALKWDDINIKKMTCSINKSVVVLTGHEYISTTKTKKSRVVPINQKLLDELLKLKEYKSEFVFPDYRDKHKFISPRTISNTYIALQKRIGIKKGIHVFRHTFISNALEKGLSLKLIMQIVGHTNLSTTQRYWHPESDKFDAVRNLYIES